MGMKDAESSGMWIPEQDAPGGAAKKPSVLRAAKKRGGGERAHWSRAIGYVWADVLSTSAQRGIDDEPSRR